MAFVMHAVTATPVLAQVPAGSEFRVNAYTTDSQFGASAAIHSSGRFTVTWHSRGQDGGGFGVYAQRYSEDGTPAGNEFLVPTYTTSTQASAVVTYGRAGNSVIVWHGDATDFDILGQRYAPDGQPSGGEFVVNTITAGTQYKPDMAPLPNGGFVVVWPDHSGQDTIRARRFDALGIPMGPELQANELSHVSPNHPAIASGGDGRFVIVWIDSFHRVAARLYDAAGIPLGAQFLVATAPLSYDSWPQVAMADDGAFVVVWERNNSPPADIHGRLFSSAGTPLGADFRVSDNTVAGQVVPKLATNRVGDFVIGWTSRLGITSDVVARRFTSNGVPRGGDFRVNTFTTGNQGVNGVASDEVGNFVVTWSGDGKDGSGYGVFAQRFGGLLPAALAVDPAYSPLSDGNGVLEPGESVGVRSSWRNVNGTEQIFAGSMAFFVGPAAASHTITDATASYGTVANGATAPCSDCYAVSVSAPDPRPVQHWDSVAQEDIAPDTHGQRKQWRVHVGDSFADVPRSSGFYRFVETVFHHSVTGGCDATQYCPLDTTTREQMAVFVLAGEGGTRHHPSRLHATPMFADVPASSPFCPWIEELARRGVVSGCGDGNYCPKPR